MGDVKTIVKDILVQTEWAILSYATIAQITYFFLLLLATLSLMKHKRQKRIRQVYEADQEEYIPPVSLVIPSFNEAEVIVQSVNGFLGMEYPHYDVIVVNDGSTDASLEVLKESFKLVRIAPLYQEEIPVKKIKGVYRSIRYPNLTVVDKENGGKADAINAGINVSRMPFFCVVDADSIIERSALTKLIEPFISHRQEVVASGGIVLISNGCTIKKGKLIHKALPKNFWARIQLSDYLRSFLVGRMAWDYMNGLLIIAGAFGMFKRRAVVEVGGYATDTVGEDMEITVRLQRYSHEHKKNWKVSFVPDTACWTQVPANAADLGKQRNRWHRGLLETLWRHRSMIANPKQGAVGLLAIPYFIMIEVLGPILGFLGLILAPETVLFGLIDWRAISYLFGAIWGFNFIMTLTSLIIENHLFKRYERTSSMLIVAFFSFAETILLRPLNFIWKMKALIHLKTRKSSWDKLKREKIGLPH